MVALRRSRTQASSASNEKKPNENAEMLSESEKKMVGYEQLRLERIKMNLERMQQFGITNLSIELSSPAKSLKRKARDTPEKKMPTRPLNPRRSSRLQNVARANYVEIRRNKSQESKTVEVSDSDHLMPEIYTDEDEKRLGSCESGWVLFRDGYGKDGRRIYDPVKGKTCHQCRQKTLGHRTSCSKCKIIQGQFCGDCLYMRYGENLLEAIKKPDWICPVCRGICNCSVCRLKKGWPPTGALYRKIKSLGFTSVAQYLIKTRRSINDSENPVPEDKKEEDLSPSNKVYEEEDLPPQPSARRSLSLSDTHHASLEKNTSITNSEFDLGQEGEVLISENNPRIDSNVNTSDGEEGELLISDLFKNKKADQESIARLRTRFNLA
ncbi:hypothetical protein AMTRI_Chr13g124850 [Amborella trichopoda]